MEMSASPLRSMAAYEFFELEIRSDNIENQGYYWDIEYKSSNGLLSIP